MDACLNKSTIGKDRYVCGVAFKDHTWCTYSMNATTDIEAQGLLRKYFDERIKNGNGFNEDSATVEFIKVLRVEKIEEEYEDDDDFAMNNKPTKIMVAKGFGDVDYNADLDDIEYYGIDPEDDDDLEDDVHQ